MTAKKKKVVDKIADKMVEISTKAAKVALESGTEKHKATATDEDWYPATKKMPCKPIHSCGDAAFCSTCKSNTAYKGLCAVCGIKPEEIRLKHIGEINYLREKYPLYCR
jgi:hypothetical protein